MQVYELADELGVRSIDVIDAAAAAGLPGLGAGSEVDPARLDAVRSAHARRLAQVAAAQPATPVPQPVPAAVGASTFAADATPLGAPPLGWVPPPSVDGPPPGWQPGMPTTPPPGGWGAAPAAAAPAPVAISHGKPPTHPLVGKAILHLVLGHVVPCFGLYFWVSSYVTAGKARRQIEWSGGRYGGDTAALVIRIVFWIEVVLLVLYTAAVLTKIANTPLPPAPTGR